MQSNIFESELLTPIQASEFLGVSEQTLAIWRSTKRYNLKYVKVGRHVRYRLHDLLLFLESRTFGSEEGSANV